MPVRYLGALGVVLMLAGPALAAGDSVDEIVKALTPKEGFETPGARSLRGLIATETTAPPSIDIRVEFEYNSAKLDDDARIVLNRLGEALADKSLATFRFKIAGHTDARGTDEFNLDLSLRRAQAVVDYLHGSLGIALDRLQPEGHGESELFDPAHPEDGVNRRVQIVNLGTGG